MLSNLGVDVGWTSKGYFYVTQTFYDRRIGATVTKPLTITAIESESKRDGTIRVRRHVRVRIGSNYRSLDVARIVYAKFNGEISDKEIIQYKDGDSDNLHPDNLCTISCSEAMKERYK